MRLCLGQLYLGCCIWAAIFGWLGQTPKACEARALQDAAQARVANALQRLGACDQRLLGNGGAILEATLVAHQACHLVDLVGGTIAARKQLLDAPPLPSVDARKAQDQRIGDLTLLRSSPRRLPNVLLSPR